MRVNGAVNDAIGAYPGGYHEVAHNGAGTDTSMVEPAVLENLGAMLRDGGRNFFAGAYLDLVSKLDGIGEGDGTMLDNSLVCWTQEAGSSTHNGDSIPIVTAGGAGDRLNTGLYLDFRNRPEMRFNAEQHIYANEGRRPGACFFQWTTTYLDAFGVGREEWQTAERRAFSAMGPNHTWMRMQYDQAAMDASCDDPLPHLMRG